MKPHSKILVTGGAGFIGTNLCAKLIKDGHRVVVLDNLYTGRQKNIDYLEKLAYENDMSVLNHEPTLSPNFDCDFQFINYDVTRSFYSNGCHLNPVCALPAIGLFDKVDMIFHLACPASPSKYQINMVNTLNTCVAGTYNVLLVATEMKIPMVFTSTSEIYGDPDKFHPFQNEEYWGNVNPMGVRSCYDEGKRCAESYCFAAHRQCGTDVRVARLFNSYGPHMDPDDGRVVSTFIMQALKNQPITIYGTGSQQRSYCYVDDTIRGLIALMDHPVHTDKDGKLQAINFGNNAECYTVKHLAMLIKEMTNSSSEIIYKDLPEDDPHTRRPALASAMMHCDWEAKCDLRHGLEKTIEYFKQYV